MNLADRIQHLRKSRGISQEELADKIGVSRQAVSKWESEQSIPDMEKVILLSDYFETTTDFLLKGIEPAQKREKKWSATVFALAGTVINAIGLVSSIIYWMETQTFYATGLGLAVMLLGTGVFLAGQVTDTTEKQKAAYLFILPNVWILLFIPSSCCFNMLDGLWGPLVGLPLFTGLPAPIPHYGNSFLSYGLYWIAYIAACVAVDVATIKKLKRETVGYV